MEIDLVVFDLAGTTMHDGDAVHVALREALAAVGVWPWRDGAPAPVGLPAPDAIRTLIAQARGQAAATPATVEAVYADVMRRLLWHVESHPGVKVCEGAEDLLVWCRARGIKTALDTSLPRVTSDVVLSRLKWLGAGLFDAIVVNDEALFPRPHPDHIHRAMALAGVPEPERVMSVGDSPMDVAAGVAARCGAVVGVTSGAATAEELQVGGATHLVSRLLDVRAILAPAEADAA